MRPTRLKNQNALRSPDAGSIIRHVPDRLLIASEYFLTILVQSVSLTRNKELMYGWNRTLRNKNKKLLEKLPDISSKIREFFYEN